MRIFVSAIAGVATAIVLFLLMSSMIAGSAEITRNPNDRLNLDFIQLDLDEVENIRRRIPLPEPEELVERPELPLPEPVVQEVAVPTMPDFDFSGLLAAGARSVTALDKSRFQGYFDGDISEDGDVVPILMVEPIYPASAQMRGIIGWVDLEYVVMPDGSVANARVIDATPAGQFEEAALQAIARWKFKPRVVDGKAVPRGVEQRMNFNLY